MHDEHKDILFLIIVIFTIIISAVIVIGIHPKGDRHQVKTLISQDFIN